MKTLLHIAGSLTAHKDDKGAIYFNGNYTHDVWQRYFEIANEVIVLCKLDSTIYTEEKARSRFIPSPNDGFKVIVIHDTFKSIRAFCSVKTRKNNRLILRQAISNCDGIDIKNLGFVSTAFFLKVVRDTGKKYLYECIGDAWDAMWNHGWKGKILAPICFLNQKRIAKNADMVVYVTEEYLQRRYPTCSPNIGITDVSIPNDSDIILKKRIDRIMSDKDRIIIGTTAGVEVPYKGQKYVIQALGYLKRIGIDCFEYQLVGNGDPERLIEAAKQENVQDQVLFLGPKTHDDVFKWLSSIDIYVQPSLQEGLPRALIEAMSMALPAIGSDAGGIPELLREDCVFAKKNVRQLANLLVSVCKTDRMLTEAKRNAEYIKIKYNQDIISARRHYYYSWFNQMCENENE